MGAIACNRDIHMRLPASISYENPSRLSNNWTHSFSLLCHANRISPFAIKVISTIASIGADKKGKIHKRDVWFASDKASCASSPNSKLKYATLGGKRI